MTSSVIPVNPPLGGSVGLTIEHLNTPKGEAEFSRGRIARPQNNWKDVRMKKFLFQKLLDRAPSAAIIIMWLLLDASVQANVVTWTGGGTSAYWSDSGNWSGAGILNYGDILVFPAGQPRLSNINDFAGLSLGSIRF